MLLDGNLSLKAASSVRQIQDLAQGNLRKNGGVMRKIFRITLAAIKACEENGSTAGYSEVRAFPQRARVLFHTRCHHYSSFRPPLFLRTSGVHHVKHWSAWFPGPWLCSAGVARDVVWVAPLDRAHGCTKH